MLHREQMGFYRVAHYHIVPNGGNGDAHWEVDSPPGCPWCGGIPEDMRPVLGDYRVAQEMKAYRKRGKKRGKTFPV